MNLKNASLLVAVAALAGAISVAATWSKSPLPAKPVSDGVKSGLNIGERMLAFETWHVSGPDVGTDTCPICKYGTLPGVMVFVNGEDQETVKGVSDKLDKVVAESKHDLHAFVVMLTKDDDDVANVKAAYANKYKHLAVTYLPVSDSVVKAYKIDTSGRVRTTAMVYRGMKVTDVLVNLGDKGNSIDDLVAAAKKADAAG